MIIVINNSSTNSIIDHDNSRNLENSNIINSDNYVDNDINNAKPFEKEIDLYLNRLESDNQFIHQKAINYLIQLQNKVNKISLQLQNQENEISLQ